MVALAAGLVALGFAAGQYVEGRSGARIPAPPAAPTGPAPPYLAHASFAPRSPFPEPLVRAPATGDSAELAEVLAEDDAFRRTERLAALLPTLGPEALPELREALEHAGQMDAVTLSLLTRFWATHAPDEAGSWAAYQSPITYRGSTTVAAVETWAASDAPAAAKLVRALALLPGQDFSEAERALIRTWFETGQPGIETYIRDLGLTINRQRALRSFFLSAVRRDGPGPAGRWAEAIPDDQKKFKIDAFRQLGSVLTQLDPRDGVAWCDAHCDGRFGGALRMIVAQQWAAQDGPAAMEWVSQAPAGLERDVAVRGALRGWARNDLDSLHRWANEMGPEGVAAWFEPAVAALAASLIQSSPEQAMAWAEHIADDVTREGSLVALAREWRKRDPKAAEAWVANSPLLPQARERALAPLRPEKRRPGGAAADAPARTEGTDEPAPDNEQATNSEGG